MRLRPWAIARAALAESFGRPIACFRQHWLLALFVLVCDAIGQAAIGDALHYEGWGWRLEQRWILNALLESYSGTIASIYIYRRLVLDEPFTLATLLPPLRRFFLTFLTVIVLRLAFTASLPFFGVVVWPIGFSFYQQPYTGFGLGAVWLLLLNVPFCRFGPAFVMIAFDHQGPVFGPSWAMTHGQVWRILLAIVYGLAPALLAGMAVSAVTNFAFDDPKGPAASLLMIGVSALLAVPTYHALGAIGLAIYRALTPAGAKEV